MNKRGFIRTIEAVIAIVLLLGFILYIFSGAPKILQRTPDVVKTTNEFLINEFLNNNTFRKCFVNTLSEGSCGVVFSTITATSEPRLCSDVVADFITKSLPPGYNYACEVCKSSKSCSNTNAPAEKSVYPKSGFIYSDATKEARIVRVYLF